MQLFKEAGIYFVQNVRSESNPCEKGVEETTLFKPSIPTPLYESCTFPCSE